jgi:hypothetical protein
MSSPIQKPGEKYSMRQKHRNTDKLRDEQIDRSSIPPANGLLYALSAGTLGGLMIVGISVAITLLNAQAFRDATRLQGNMSYSTASTLAGLTCLSYVVTLALCFASGFTTGKFAVRRMYGFYAGALAGAITYIGSFLVQYIPDYPGHVASTSTISALARGSLFVIVLLLIYGAIGALMGLWGAWTATRKHPYYRAELTEEE